ncbi:MAG: TIR domain-containing protein [Methylococcales bacterium]
MPERPLPERPLPDKFLVAFSFAGEQRELVRSVAEAVEQRLGHGTVFLDEWYEHVISGFGADLRLQEIYQNRTELVVSCISERYGNKPWTLAEFEAIPALKMQLSASEDPRDSFRILPLRVGEGDVKGIFVNVIYPDIRPKPADQTAELIISRLRLIRPDLDAGSTSGEAPDSRHRVYLAEYTPDLEDIDKPINRPRLKTFLEELGYEVLPAIEYPAEQYQALLEQDLKQCIAFVQLIGPYPWKRGGFDRIQNDTALALGIPRFRCRSPEIDLDKLEPSQQDFLTAPNIIVSGFEDFKEHLKKNLMVLAQQRDRPPDPDSPPLVVVAITSPNPDPLWERVFRWIYEQEGIDPYQLGPGETIESWSQAERCHGFLIACDASALDDGSPREVIEQCRQIQLGEKSAARRPPVALVYWPPPAPSWAKLLRSTPSKLHRVLGDEPEKLADFFTEVRKVAQ